MSDATEPAEGATVEETEHLEQAREVITMALYVSLSLLTVLIALPITSTDARWKAGFTVLLTALGLVLAHHMAFRMSTRLVNGGLLTPESREALKAQAMGGLPVAVIAALPVFVLGEDPGETISEVLLIGFVGLVGYRCARYSSGVGRSLAYVGVVVLGAVAVLTVKLYAGH